MLGCGNGNVLAWTYPAGAHAAFGSLKSCNVLKKHSRHFPLAGGALMNIKDSLVLLCRKAFKPDLNSALSSPCVAFSPSPFFSPGSFPSVSSSDLPVSSFFLLASLFFYYILALRLLLSWGNMIKSSEDSGIAAGGIRPHVFNEGRVQVIALTT